MQSVYTEAGASAWKEGMAEDSVREKVSWCRITFQEVPQVLCGSGGFIFHRQWFFNSIWNDKPRKQRVWVLPVFNFLLAKGMPS